MGSPITGVFYYDHIGKHSTMLDVFARYGVAPGMMLVYMIFSPLKPLLVFSNKASNVGFACAFAALCLSLLNQVPMSLGLFLFILLPVSVVIFNEEKEGRV